MYKDIDWKLAICSALLGASLMAAPFITNSISSKDETDTTIVSKHSYETDSFDELVESFYHEELSATQMQESLNRYLGYFPVFSSDIPSETNDSVVSSETELTKEEKANQDKIITAYLDGLFIQQNKLNRIATLYSNELQILETTSQVTLKNDVVEVENLKSPVVEGLLKEMQDTPLYLHSEDDTYSVWVDYGEILEVYKDYLSEFHHNLADFHKDVIRFGYRRADGEIDAKVIYNRLIILDKIQDGDRTKDDFYWENERYQLAILFTGFGDDQKPIWDEVRINQMIEIAISDNENHDTYSSLAKELTDSIQEEGQYGEDSARIANKWMNEEFSIYKDFMEKKVIEDAST